jgi:hypothetical protein
MKQYFFITDLKPRTKAWSPSVLHATPYRTQSDAEAAIKKLGIGDATGTEEFQDYWYIVKGLSVRD